MPNTSAHRSAQLDYEKKTVKSKLGGLKRRVNHDLFWEVSRVKAILFPNW